ncbi:MAG TPA: hypothetical protein P5055_08060 [Candidatus Paceibacterota bacterium]|nr:hypothetical protein [Candidatus Paceibacterota bacterium]
MGVSVCLASYLSRSIRRVVEAVKSSSDQVTAASGQVAATSQHLAEGTTEQAAATIGSCG